MKIQLKNTVFQRILQPMKNVRPNGKALLVFTTTTERSCKKIPLSKFPFSTFPKKERICVMTKQKKERNRKKLERSDINTTLLYNDQRFSTWGTRTPGGTPSIHRGYATSWQGD